MVCGQLPGKFESQFHPSFVNHFSSLSFQLPVTRSAAANRATMQQAFEPYGGSLKVQKANSSELTLSLALHPWPSLAEQDLKLGIAGTVFAKMNRSPPSNAH